MAASKSSKLSKAVDGGEAEVCDFIQFAQRLEDGETDLVRLYLGAALGANALLDALGEDGQVILGDRTALAGLAYADEDLLAAERLGDAGPLDDAEARGFDGGEATPTFRALPATPNGSAVVGGP